MDGKVKIVTPRYQQIAVDIAGRIVDKHYEVGGKVYARSALASQYGVSSETARRAISVLSDMNIVDVTKGSGVVIKSYENAVKFIKQYNDIQTLNDLKLNILQKVESQIEENLALKEDVVKLVERIDRFKSSNPFVPFELMITKDTPYLNRTSSDVNFWHNTSATIIAIKRGDEMLMSPGPYATFCEDDMIYFIGDECSYERVQHFMYPKF
ncbi:GntR family transcriptional regulator [Sinanaerobacter chloroacetimidivorans]|uniref:GntR family transcriptional regulator n=1 Tax=Sinanaerobacter chloroacetimidivorans TaxID=2818044 RepID=A0A8J7W0A3_9FIRM|nr:GntR family transcriptional regulator [Sinanaerobacter chloroacetimidivorans]MBR0597994.1 GntR family transcriptional regulator [Sinanaerobacter chloroacetimidivorans]